MLDGAARLKELLAEVKQPGHDARGDDRPRQHVRRRRVPPAGQGGRRHAGDRDRGLRRARVPDQHQPHPVGPAAPEEGRRLRLAALTCTRPSGPEQRGPAQPVPALLPLLRRGLAGQVAPDGQGAHRRALGRADGLDRLPVGRAADQAAARPVRRGAQGRGRVAGHLRQGELLPGADGPRPGHRAAGPRRPDRDRQKARHPAGRHQRLALHPRAGRPGAGHAAVHPDRQDPGRHRPVPVRRHRLLHQARRPRCTPWTQRPVAAGLPQQPAPDRRPGRHQPACSSSST